MRATLGNIKGQDIAPAAAAMNIQRKTGSEGGLFQFGLIQLYPEYAIRHILFESHTNHCIKGQPLLRRKIPHHREKHAHKSCTIRTSHFILPHIELIVFDHETQLCIP
ncbi:hypothetical protein [Spirochaeta thermophila]|uniref:hypothetical protein n=1 Tax=Winmispira thermophila TaxID=154 RepID=UPI001FE1DB29|nr:hypothetical protein [Spirochaeta thermophila]